jgi:urease accessory protein
LSEHASDAPRLAPGVLIELMRLASPALPVGGFSYSEGLEAAVDNGLIHDASSARAWLLDQLHLSLARCDLPLVAAAHRAWASGDLSRIDALNAWITQVRETRELQLQSQQMGRSLVLWLLARRSDDNAADDAALRHAAALEPAPAWPIAFALAAARAGAPPHDSVLAFALGWSESVVQAALKAVPLGQNAGQRLLDALAAELPAAVDTALSLRDDQRQAFAPRLAILSAQHETQYSRLFRS